MNDEFLKAFKKPPEAGFLERLHSRVSRKEKLAAVRKSILLAALTLFLVLGAALTTSAPVRAEILALLEKVAGLKFDVVEEIPEWDGPVEIIPSRTLTLEEARQEFASPISLPAYVPAGYILTSIVIWELTPNEPVLYITWEGQERIVTLQIYRMARAGDYRQTVGPGALEEVLVGDRPAAVVRGAWNADTQEYDLNGMIALIWEYDDETIYSLNAVEPSMSLEELIRIAESIP